MLENSLKLLNPKQQEAVVHDSNPLLILAGAGSGKTRVITHKIAWFIEKLHYDPRSILAVTFTNKAAQEMRQRAEALCPAASKVVIRTFHSFGAWLIRRNHASLGVSPNFTIYDEQDSLSLLSYLYPDRSRPQLGYLQHCISRAKDASLLPIENLSGISTDPEFPEIYARYNSYLADIGNVDFGDLIMLPIQLLQGEDIIAKRLRDRFSIVLVDEYQDSNIAQYNLLKSLFQEGSYICVVGDDDQSIYRFRGAEVRNILEFPKHFASADIIKLEQNYRSTNPILKLAAAVVRHNEGRIAKELWTERQDNAKPVVSFHISEEDEFTYILNLITNEFQGNTAILYRTNAQSRFYESQLIQAGIPYKIVGTLRFYEREEVKDAIALLKLIANPQDIVAFARIVNKPKRGVGAASIEKIRMRWGKNDIIQVIENMDKGFGEKARLGLRRFAKTLRQGEKLLSGNLINLGKLVQILLEESELLQYHIEQDEVTGTSKLQNLEELINVASSFSADTPGLIEFLEQIELDSTGEQKNPNARVILITMHNTKGLEFDRVIITGLEEGRFPRADSRNELEEERRLFYVSVTRAREELHITHCMQRRIHGKIQFLGPSEFLEEIPSSLFEYKDFTFRNVQEQIYQQRTAGQSQIDLEYPRGQLVYHEEYGTGEVIKNNFNGRDEVIIVRFETGHTATFIPRYNLVEKISN